MKILLLVFFSLHLYCDSIELSFTTTSELENNVLQLKGHIDFLGTARLRDFYLTTEINGENIELTNKEWVYKGLQLDFEGRVKLDDPVSVGHYQYPLVASFYDTNGAKFRQFGFFNLNINPTRPNDKLLIVQANSVTNLKPELVLNVFNPLKTDVEVEIRGFLPSLITPFSVFRKVIIPQGQRKKVSFNLNVPYISDNFFQGLYILKYKAFDQFFAQSGFFQVQTLSPKRYSVFLLGDDYLLYIGLGLIMLVFIEPLIRVVKYKFSGGRHGF